MSERNWITREELAALPQSKEPLHHVVRIGPPTFYQQPKMKDPLITDPITLGCPADVRLLLDIHVGLVKTSPSKGHPTVSLLRDAGCIHVAEDVITILPLGKAWVRAICSTPCPPPAFVDAHGKVIEP